MIRCTAPLTLLAFRPFAAPVTELIDIGASRRVAQVTSKELWADWPREAQHVLLPDELDTKQRYHAFYVMPTTGYKGRSLDELKGKPIRLECFLRSCDLFSCRAAGK